MSAPKNVTAQVRGYAERQNVEYEVALHRMHPAQQVEALDHIISVVEYNNRVTGGDLFRSRVFANHNAALEEYIGVANHHADYTVTLTTLRVPAYVVEAGYVDDFVDAASTSKFAQWMMLARHSLRHPDRPAWVGDTEPENRRLHQTMLLSGDLRERLAAFLRARHEWLSDTVVPAHLQPWNR